MHFLTSLRRKADAFCARQRTHARRGAHLQDELAFVECLLDAIYPIDSGLVAQRQRLVRAIAVHDGAATEFGGVAA